MRGRIDLHVHTCFSDGTKTPEEVVELAKKRNLEAISISDHDVISGIDEAKKHAEKSNLEIISGIEFSARVDSSDDPIHLLGYLFDTNNFGIKQFSDSIEKIKKQTTLKKLSLANEHLNSDIKYEELANKTKGIPSAPHIAMVLLDKGYISNISEGIKLFSKGGPCRMKSYEKIHAKDAINIIHNAGGIAVLAHIFAYKHEKKFVTNEEQEKLVRELKSYGLDGVEIFIPTLTDEELDFGNYLSKEYDLIKTGGSDFHDEHFIPNNKLGGLDIDYSILEEMKKYQVKTINK